MAIPAAGNYLFTLVFGEFVIFYCRNGYIRSLRFDGLSDRQTEICITETKHSPVLLNRGVFITV